MTARAVTSPVSIRAELSFTPGQTDEMALRGKTVVMIDVLRASTTIAVALRNGAREIIPVTTVESAVKLSGNLFGDVILLGGERNGKAIEGFHLGNSPAEYSGERVRGKSIIFSTTNGSQAMVRARHSRELLVCAFVNISAVTAALLRSPRDIVIVCAGKDGGFSLEDAVCAGMLIQKMGEDPAIELMLSDAALGAQTLYRALGRNILKMLRSSEHGRYLADLGLGDDLVLCAGIDTVPVLPELSGSVVKLRREAETAGQARQTVTS